MRINNLANQIISATVDSTSRRIDERLHKTPQQLVPEIRADFQDATGRRSVDKSCLVSLMAAYKRALNSLGYNELSEYLPQSLTLCRAFIADKKAKPFLHRVKNNSGTIESYIRENNLSAGTIVFFPRQVLHNGIVNYHATSVEKAADDNIQLNEDDAIKLQANNRVAKNRSIEYYSNYSRQRCPRRDVYIFDLRELVEYSLHQAIKDKESRADTLEYLYSNGEDFKKDIMMNMPIIPQLREKPQVVQPGKLTINKTEAAKQPIAVRAYRRKGRNIA